MGGLEANILFLFFLCFFQIAIWNVVSSVFLERAIRAVSADTQQMADTKMKQQKDHVNFLIGLLDSCQTDGDDCISKIEFLKAAHDPMVRAHFALYGLDITNPQKFWAMITSAFGKRSSDGIGVKDLAQALAELGGPASRAGLYTLTYDIYEM